MRAGATAKGAWTMKVADVVKAMEALAPRALATEGDNVGLLVGDPDATVRKVLLAVDAMPAVVAEAARVKAQMLVAHHPVISESISRRSPVT